jgi:hypothetical protein
VPGTPADAELVRRLQEQERRQIENLPPLPSREPATIHYTQLPGPIPGSPIASEWDHYRREVGRLLAEGHEGKWVLIKGEQTVGLWSSEEEADQVRVERFLMQPVLMKQVLARELVLRVALRPAGRSCSGGIPGTSGLGKTSPVA